MNILIFGCVLNGFFKSVFYLLFSSAESAYLSFGQKHKSEKQGNADFFADFGKAVIIGNFNGNGF